MGQALYRKYRSRSWDELVGQEHVRATLQNAVKAGKFGHAYLFSGPRGVGKTSVARLLAHQINGLDYIGDEPHVDIIEIDAASNTSVEDIRDLREKVAVAPSLAKYKVYIIDEVHMLSKSAFNALLKTLEEPPAHVIFILATTDPQKLPETIISRTQHFTFKPIDLKLAARELKSIAKKEEIKLDDDAAELIADLGEGSFRDSLSLLDQLAASGNKITRKEVEAIAGLPPAELVEQLAEAVNKHDPKTVISLLAQAQEKGFQANPLASHLSKFWRSQAISESDMSKLALARQLLSVGSSFRPSELLDIILLEATLAGTNPSQSSAKQKPEKSEPLKDPEPPKTAIKPLKTSDIGQEAVEPAATNKEALNQADAADAEKLWRAALEDIRTKHPTLYTQARLAKPSLNEDGLKLEFGHKFQYERLKSGKNHEIVSRAVAVLSGRDIAITCELNPELANYSPGLAESKAAKDDQPPTEPASWEINSGDINNISNIFGGGELLQS